MKITVTDTSTNILSLMSTEQKQSVAGRLECGSISSTALLLIQNISGNDVFLEIGAAAVESECIKIADGLSITLPRTDLTKINLISGTDSDVVILIDNP